MMDCDDYQLQREERIRLGQERRRKAKEEFPNASSFASSNGLILQTSGTEGIRYRLCYKNLWFMDVYPGNQRIYSPDLKKKGPFLSLPVEWGLMDIVKAAIESIEPA